MSRTNPYKKKRRAADKTLLMYGEGLAEEMFLKHLRSLYSRDSGVSVVVRNGRGGNAVDIVLNASKEPGDFDRRIVVLDNDKGSSEMNEARIEAGRRNIEIIENTPCLEALLLSILENSSSTAIRASDWYKKEFESKYLDKKKRTDSREYETLLPKDLLEKRRSKLPALNAILTLMGG